MARLQQRCLCSRSLISNNNIWRIMMRFGLVGYGAFGRWHARCIDTVETAGLAAICAHGEASAAAARADFPDVKIYRDYRELVAAADIDVVDIVVPNHLHAEVGIAALAAGKDILLEKPMANSIADCDQLIAAANKNNRLISLGFELRVSHQWGTVKQLIDDGAIGRPRYANLSLFRFPYRPGAGGWRHDPQRVGSWILEEPVHFFDLLMWYFERNGDPVAVRARGTPSGRGRGTYDNFSTVLRFADGAYVTITQSLAGFGHHTLLEITGDSGAIRSWWSAADARSLEPRYELQLQRAGSSEAETIVLQKSGEIFELEEQVRRTVAAFSERRALVSGEEAKKRIVVCLEAERSLEQGGEIALWPA
jgi:myo-inositol 2-dehydrogenase/D-chiro-inositol 1-dehydrogenase